MTFLSKVRSFIILFWKAVKGSEEDFTSGSINRAIFLLSIPMVLEMAMESILAVVDIYFVNKLNSNEAVAIVASTESLVAIIYSIAWGLGMGITAYVARRIGEKDPADAATAAVNALYLGLGISVIISLIGIFFSVDLLRLVGASEKMIATGAGYTKWMIAGNLTIVLLFLINAIFRGAGDASIAMRSLWIANILNIILDPILIFGWGPIQPMGVEGAAIATNIGRGCGVLYQIVLLTRGIGVVKIKRSNFHMDLSIIFKIVKVSIGSIGQFLISTVSWVFLGSIVLRSGDAAAAGYGTAIRVIIFTILPSWGMANAAATLVGQNLGAGKPERAEQSVWRACVLNMCFLGIISLGFFLLAEPIMRIFTQDAEAIRYGVKCLTIVAFGYVFYGYGMVLVQAFNGAGDSRTPTIINLFNYWFFQVPLAYFMAVTLGFGASGAFWAIAIAESVLAVVAILVFRRGKWKQVKI